jgi:fructose-1-phosphate kinase PfkB-like protein
VRVNFSEEEIDKIVVSQADDDSAWEKPIQVRKAKPISLSVPAELAARAAFLARLHREASVEEWLKSGL